jgi:hypothetical protein
MSKLCLYEETLTDPTNELTDDEALLFHGSFAITEESWLNEFAPLKKELG